MECFVVTRSVHLQALAITCMALHYHSQVWGTSFHELIIISAAFGGYIVILVGILTGIFTGQPINKRIVSTSPSHQNCNGASLLVYSAHRDLRPARVSELYLTYPENTGVHVQALII